jgi:hypothetical protein
MKYTTEFRMPFPTPEDRAVSPSYIQFEDGGQAAIANILDEEETGGDGHLTVNLQSWVEGGRRHQHKLFTQMYGKRVRITVETLD